MATCKIHVCGGNTVTRKFANLGRSSIYRWFCWRCGGDVWRRKTADPCAILLAVAFFIHDAHQELGLTSSVCLKQEQLIPQTNSNSLLLFQQSTRRNTERKTQDSTQRESSSTKHSLLDSTVPSHSRTCDHQRVDVRRTWRTPTKTRNHCEDSYPQSSVSLSLSCTLSINLPLSLVLHGARAILIRPLLVVGVVLVDGVEHTARRWEGRCCTYSN